MSPTYAVVLAGGASRRFGADKLGADLAGSRLLDRTLAGLPTGAVVLVVGPERPLERPVRFVREDPPGGGPAAGLVAGLVAALDAGADRILVVPGDAPDSGAGGTLLLAALEHQAVPWAVVGRDAAGVVQPLQVGLTAAAAERLVELAGPGGGTGASARRLLERLTPPAEPVALSRSATWDIDTPDQLHAWTVRRSPAVVEILLRVGGLPPPVVVAVDGPGRAGKSTLAAALAMTQDAAVVPCDGVDHTILRAEVAARRAAPLIVLDGLGSAHPDLADLLDLAVHVAGTPRTQDERHYFERVRPPASFDVHVPARS